MAQVTYRGVQYDTNERKQTTSAKSELTYRGVKHSSKLATAWLQLKNKLEGLLTDPLFLCKIDKYHIKIMDKGKLKVLLFDLKNIVNEIESEVYSDVEAYTDNSKELAFSSAPTNYDEVFEDDDGWLFRWSIET